MEIFAFYVGVFSLILTGLAVITAILEYFYL